MHEIIAALNNLGEEAITAVSHLAPDGDATGSLVAATLLLRYLGHTVTCYAPEGCPEGLEDILADGQPTTIDPGHKHILSLDTAVAAKMGLDLKDTTVFVIDHHRSNPGYGTANWIDSESATCSAMVWELATSLAIAGNEGAKKALADHRFQRACYIGVITDTGRFRHTNVNGRLMRVCGEILDHGLTMDTMQTYLEHKVSLKVQKRVGEALADLKSDLGGRMLSCYMDLTGFSKPEIDSIKGQLFSIMSQTKCVDLVLLIRRTESSDKLHCSIRCNTAAKWDVNVVAGCFGGGGHTAASGFSATPPIRDRADEVRGQVADIIQSTYDLKPDGASADK